MTLVIEVPGHPNRLACEKCGCTIGARRKDGPWMPLNDIGSSTGDWFHDVDIDEMPARINIMDGCPCHDAYLHMMRNKYDEVS